VSTRRAWYYQWYPVDVSTCRCLCWICCFTTSTLSTGICSPGGRIDSPVVASIVHVWRSHRRLVPQERAASRCCCCGGRCCRGQLVKSNSVHHAGIAALYTNSCVLSRLQ
jgi:hypothetical protein